MVVDVIMTSIKANLKPQAKRNLFFLKGIGEVKDICTVNQNVCACLNHGLLSFLFHFFVYHIGGRA